ncbi:MAG: SGNH/GDSL hydrolase family protein [Planctomycetota bacterium]
MRWNNLALANCAELSPTPAGQRPQRYPSPVIAALSERGRIAAVKPANVELRWLPNDPAAEVEITLASEGLTKAAAFFGAFVHGDVHRIVSGEPVTLRLAPPERYGPLIDRLPRCNGFDPRVGRLMFWGDDLDLIDAVGDVRPPTPSELPARRLLTYGTSITHGASCSAPHLTYPSQLARLLGMDLINLGLGGSCLCEPEVADYIAGRGDWDAAVFALSVNMVNQGFTLDAFRKRVAYLVHQAAATHPDKPIFCVTIWPYFADLDRSLQPAATAEPEAFRDALRGVVADCPAGRVTLLEGPDLLADFAGLTTDLLHPSDLGFIEMAHRLADAMRSAIG